MDFDSQENVEKTSDFVALIYLLRTLHPSRWPSPASEDALVSRSQNFYDLVVKFLIKLTKVRIFMIDFVYRS